MRSDRLPHVQAFESKGKHYLYYRRGAVRVSLPGPENGEAFLAAYDRVHRLAESGGVGAAAEHWPAHSIGAAVTNYMRTPEFIGLSEDSKRQYRHYLDLVRGNFGKFPMAGMDYGFVAELRNKYAHQPNTWNGLRARMALVVDDYMKHHPKEMAANPWRQAKRIVAEDSDQNRPWPDDVIEEVMRAATTEFRALLLTLILTSQRVGDVVGFVQDQYDPDRRTLAFKQGKTGKDQVIHVPEALSQAFAAMRQRAQSKDPRTGRPAWRLLCTPRGKPWTKVNAEETLLRMRANLGLDRYCLHGLRATAATSLKMLGFENRAIRSLTGHDSDQNLELYLRGVDGYALAKPAQEALEARFAQVFENASFGANATKASGATGRAAAVAGKSGDALAAARAKRRETQEAANRAEMARTKGVRRPR